MCVICERSGYNGSVVDPKLFYPDPTLTLVSDPDSNPDPACL
jgi:hypothetical protein